ncbi:MAG: Clp protease ClpP [Dethiosulfatibacter sp.]|nr:Clp protease ClpP [Dethiosulfatibacter sp.]
MKFWNFKQTDNTEEVELRIDGDIVDDDETWIYEWFKQPCASPNSFREELKTFKNKNLTIWIDSYGGSVFAATGIYNALKEHKGNIRVKIDGKAMSAATLIAMAGDHVAMSPAAIMMVHNPLTFAQGYAEDLRKTAEVLDEVKDAIINTYQLKTKRPRSKISELMDNETYMSAKSALAEGFIDEILYSDGEDYTETYNFDFSRKTIVNSASETVDKILEFKASQKAQNQQKEPEEESINTQNTLKYLEMEETLNGKNLK